MIIPEASPEVYSPMSLVELVRGAVSSTQQQQNTAAPQQTIIRSLDQVLCPVYARRDQPDVDALPLDRKHNGEEGRGKAMESNLNLNFQTFKPASLHFQQNADYKISTETKRKFNKFRFVITKLINMNVQKTICITKCSSLEERRCDTPAKKTIKQMIPSDVFSKVVVRREKAALDDDIEH